jgi:LCP family protein required for cell wall assembly
MTVAKQYRGYSPYTKPKRPSRHEPSWFLLVMLTGILCGVLLFVVGWYMSLPSPQREALMDKMLSARELFADIPGLNRSRVLLVMGVDMPPRGVGEETYQGVRTDTMMLVRVDSREAKVNLLSIPRDSRVFIAGTDHIDKINAALPLGGVETAVTTVEQTFGVDVTNYVIINIRGVRDVVDAVGGLDLYIEKPMRYTDHTAHLSINLQPGQQHLNGKQAEGFLRFRHDALGDIGRVRRQQQFVSAFSQAIKDPAILLQIKPLLDAGNTFLKTDLSPTDLIQLVLFAKDLNRSDIQAATLPGHPAMMGGASYWVIDTAATETMLNRMIVGGAEDTIEASEESPTVGLRYTGSYADQVSDYRRILESHGFHVVCRSPIQRSTTKLVTHNLHVSRRTNRLLQSAIPVLKDAQLIFLPHGSTFEPNASCGSPDYTIILGDDTRSTHHP